MDYRDIWSHNKKYRGVFPLNKVEAILEKKMVHEADDITTTCHSFAKSIRNDFKLDKVHVIENGFDPDELKELTSHPIFFNDGKYRILYSGSSIHNESGLTPFFQAISELSQDPTTLPLLNKLEVIFVGTEQAGIEPLATSFQVNQWVRSLGLVNREDTLRMQRDASVLLFLPSADLSESKVLPEGLFECLYSKTPMISIGDHGLEASQLLILEAGAGEVLATVEAIKDHLKKHLRKVSKVKSHVDPNILEKYTRKFLANKLLEICQQ